MRRSRQSAAALVVAALAAGGCSPNVLVAVAPCPDGGMVTNGACTGLLEELVGWWRLDEQAGSTPARDGSMFGNDGTLVGLDPATAWGTGRSGGGLVVDGAGFVNVPTSMSIDSIVQPFTLAGWGYLTGTIDDYATIASREIGTSINQHYHISINSRGELPAFWITTADGLWLLQGTKPVTRQTWVHIAGTYDGATARLYVDGEQVFSQAITGQFVADTTPVILGGNGNGAGDANVTERFPGKIDEIMLYRRALSATDIAQLHDGALLMAPRTVQDAGTSDSGMRDSGTRD